MDTKLSSLGLWFSGDNEGAQLQGYNQMTLDYDGTTALAIPEYTSSTASDGLRGARRDRNNTASRLRISAHLACSQGSFGIAQQRKVRDWTLLLHCMDGQCGYGRALLARLSRYRALHAGLWMT